MAKLFRHYQNMPLWKEAVTILLLVNRLIANQQHPLREKTLELAARLPVQLAFTGSNPNANIIAEISETLNRSIELEHFLQILDQQEPAEALDKFKDHLIALIEDHMNGVFDDDA